MPSTLSHSDVERLLAEPSASVRAELAGKLAAEIENPHLSEAESALANEIVRIMAKDIEVSVRQSLAQNLRGAQNLPHDVALRLANDIESVALPILEHSSVLTESDLIEIVRSGSPGKQVVVAGRADVSESVADALVSVGTETAVARLMDNPVAKIAESSLGKVIDRFAASDTVKEKMAKRAALPPVVTERLVTMVAAHMRDYLVAHHEISADAATDIVMQSRDRATLGISGKSSGDELERMVRQMHANQRLTPGIVLRALCMGDMAFFEMAIAVMAKVPLVNARILMHDAGSLGLKSLYERTGLPTQLLPAVRTAMDVVRETEMDGGDQGRERYRARVIQRILTRYEDMNDEDTNYLLGKLGDLLNAA